MSSLEEIDRIKQLKYRYFRYLDTKHWKELRELFADDAMSAYDSGKYGFQGPDKIVGFLESAMGRPTFVSQHQGHHPEIELMSPTRATGIWYFEDSVIDADNNTQLHGAGFYHDEYVKIDGTWKIRLTGYERTFEEVYDRSEIPSLRLTRTMFPLK